MPQEFVRRDVQLAVDQIETAMKTIDTLKKMTNVPISGRLLSIAYTNLETAGLYLRDLKNQTPESY